MLAVIFLVLAVGSVDDTVRRVAGPKVAVTRVAKDPVGHRVTGKAATHDAVADFMRAIGSLVLTSDGREGRVLEKKRGSTRVRVELLDGGVIDVEESQLSPWNVELLRAESKDSKVLHSVEFELIVNAPRS